MNLKGKKYEDIAINFLTRKGYDIIAKNFSCKMGEIDIIALRKGVLHFVEVKGEKILLEIQRSELIQRN